MTGLALLLLAAAASAYGVWASLRSRPPLATAVTAALLFAAAGLFAVLAGWVEGDGVVLPGLQLSPGLKAYYLSEAAWGLVPWIGRFFLVAAPLAHLVLVLGRRDRIALLRPLPATAIFVWLFVSIGTSSGEQVTVVRARGPGEVAYLTIASRGEGVRMILAAGDPLDVFLRIVHVHDTASTPPELHLHWTNDGKGLVVRAHEEADPAFAVDLEGNVTGLLPVEAREWPKPGAFVPPDVGKRFSRARVDVTKFIHEHQGLAPP